MRCGATALSSSAASNTGSMRCGATPFLTEEVLKAREEKKAAFLAEEAKKEKEKIEDIEKELDTEKEVEQTVLPLRERHVMTLKKEALEKGYTGEKFDKESLILFLETNQ